MTPNHCLRISAAILFTTLLAACGGHDVKPQTNAETPIAAMNFDPAKVLIDIRRAAESEHLDVVPLRDGAMTDLLEQIDRFERSHQYDKAEQVADQALELEPNNPELMQIKAELLLAQKELALAEAMARRAYQSGPEVGPLCRRSWTLISWIHEQLQQNDQLATSRAKLASCNVQGPNRF